MLSALFLPLGGATTRLPHSRHLPLYSAHLFADNTVAELATTPVPTYIESVGSRFVHARMWEELSGGV